MVCGEYHNWKKKEKERNRKGELKKGMCEPNMAGRQAPLITAGWWPFSVGRELPLGKGWEEVILLRVNIYLLNDALLTSKLLFSVGHYPEDLR